MQIIVERVVGQAGFEKRETVYEGDRYNSAAEALRACFNIPDGWTFENVRPTYAVITNPDTSERYSDCAMATAEVAEEGFES
jgi:hypothetical protein